MNETTAVLAALALSVALTSIAFAAGPEPEQSKAQPRTPTEVYVPGLGEFMGAIQLRHAKLWFAGVERNWPLAAYELGEIKEGFEDAAKFQPNFEGLPIAEMIARITTHPIERLQSAIDARDPVRFAEAFDDLSNACSSCHRAAGHEFIVIQRPTVPPFTNQRFKPQ